MSTLLAIALFGPAAALPLARFAPTAAAARRLSSLGALGFAALWLVVLVADDTATLSRFGAGAAPAAVGTWLLVSTLTWPTRRVPVAYAAVAGGVAVGGMSLLAGRGDLSDAAGALAIATAAVVLAARSEDDGGLRPASLCVLGAAAIALGVAHDGELLVTVGAAAVVTGAALRSRRVGSVLLPAALVIAIHGAGALAHGGRVAIVLAAVACAFASRPGAALGLWALAAAAVGALPAAFLLGAAAVLTTALPNPIVAAAALPGVAALAGSLADRGSTASVVLAGLAALTIALLWRAPEDALPGRPSRPAIATVLLAAWLLLAPETWSWVGRLELTGWGIGIAIALVAGGVGAFVTASFTDASFTLPDVDVADPAYAPGDPRRAWAMALAALAILAIAGAALVASSVS